MSQLVSILTCTFFCHALFALKKVGNKCPNLRQSWTKAPHFLTLNDFFGEKEFDWPKGTCGDANVDVGQRGQVASPGEEAVAHLCRWII